MEEELRIMGNEIKFYSNKSVKHENLEEFIAFEPSDKDIVYILNLIRAYNPNSIFIYGTGAQTKSRYEELLKNGINVLWFGKIKAPFIWMNILSRIIPASYRGLVKISDISQLEYVIEELTYMSSVEIYISNCEKEYRLTSISSHEEIEKVFMNETDFFQVIIDFDNFESSNGTLCIIRYGKNCPNELKSIINNFGQFGYLGYNPTEIGT